MTYIFQTEEELEKLPLLTNTYSIEAQVRIENELEIAKIFYEVTYNKLKTLEYIDKNQKNFKRIPELLLFKSYILNPENEELVGILMNRIYGKTLKDYLDTASFSDKIRILKKLGILLEKIALIKKQEHILVNFAIGDLHEHNILVDEKTEEITLIDTDGCTLEDIISSHSKYLRHLPRENLPSNLRKKYPINTFKNIQCDENTDLYCYCAMILKYLFNYTITSKNRQSFFNDLEKGLMLGLPKNLLNAFKTLYLPEKNINPYPFLDDIPEAFEKKRESPF